MKKLKFISALILVVAMTAVMAVSSFAASYDWNILNVDYSSSADLEKAKMQEGASYSVKDGVLRMNKTGANQDHYFEFAEMKTTGKVVISTKFRTNSMNMALRVNGANNSLKFNICTNGIGNLFIKGSANTVAENVWDEQWHELLVVIDLDAKTIVLTVDGGEPFNGTFANHSQSGSVDGVARVFWHVNSQASENGYLDVDYFRISDGKAASSSDSGSSDSGNADTSDPAILSAVALVIGGTAAIVVAKKRRR